MTNERRHHPRRRAYDAFEWTDVQREQQAQMVSAARAGKLLDPSGYVIAQMAYRALAASRGIPALPQRTRLWRVLRWQSTADKWFALAILSIVVLALVAIITSRPA